MIRVDDARGLSAIEARQRLALDGPNVLPVSRPRSVLRLLGDVVREPMFLLLLACGGVYLVLGDRNEALMLSNLALIHANRAWGPVSWRGNGSANHAFRWIALAAVGLLGLVLGVPAVRRVFAFAPPSAALLWIGVGTALLSLLWFEVVKWRLARQARFAA